jgi:hypothetical protein
MTIIYLTTASSSPWTVPSDWSSTDNTIECIGGGGGAAFDVATIQYGAGGGGGGYSKINNVSLVPGGSVTFQVGAGGAAGSNGTDGIAGGDTWFNGTTFTGSSVGAKGGGGGLHGGAPSYLATGGGGGAVASGIGTTTYSGGNGGPTTASGDDGGGGAAGPYGNGGNGGTGGSDQSTQGGAGGGGADDGSAGSAPSGSSGGPGEAGANGGGSGGTGANANGGTAATNGGNGTEWDASHGAGGGGGAGAGGTNAGGNGGLFGGGGGSSGVSGYGNGADGLIVITYTAAVVADATMRLEAPIRQVGWSNGSLTAELLDRLRSDGVVPSECQVSIAQTGDSELLSESLAYAPSDTEAPVENLGLENVTGHQVVPLESLTNRLRDNLPMAEIIARGPAHLVLSTENVGQATAIVDALLVAEIGGALSAEMTLPNETQLATRGENSTLDEFWITPLVQIAFNRFLRSPGRVRLLPRWQR